MNTNITNHEPKTNLTQGIADLPKFEEFTPSIARPERANHVIWLAVLSGTLSTGAVWFGMKSVPFWFGPGIVFGLLALAPWSQWCQLSPIQTGLISILSPIGYAVAASMPSAPWFAGLVGCLITFAPLSFGVNGRVGSAALLATGTGWLFGMFLAAFWPAVFFGGILVWQVGVAYALSTALRPVFRE